MSAAAAARAGQRLPTAIYNAGKLNNASQTSILVYDLPRTALPSDVRRLCAKQKVDNIAGVSMDYHGFVPTGRAWITTTHSIVLSSMVKTLHNSQLGGKLIQALPAEPSTSRPMRTRGAQGRIEAAQRGLVIGDGPDGGVTSCGRSVILSGLPGKMTQEALREYLKGYKLAGTQGGQKEIVKLEPMTEQVLSLVSRFYVRMASVSEAHRLVRRMHMTYFGHKVHNTKYLLRAHVIY